MRTAGQVGLAGLSNGKLMAAAGSAGFDVLITTDKNIAFQHNLADLPLPVVELAAVDTRLAGLLPLAAHCPAALAATARFRFVRVHADGRLDCLAER